MPNPQEEQQGEPDCKRTHSRVGFRASQLHSKVGGGTEYVGTKVMDPQDHGHHHGPMTLLASAQFARRFKTFGFDATSVFETTHVYDAGLPMVLQVVDSVSLIKNFGPDWYKNN